MPQLLVQLLIAAIFGFHLLALVVVVDGQFLQSLQNLLHLVFGRVAFLLQPGQLLLQTFIVLAAGRQQLDRWREKGRVLRLRNEGDGLENSGKTHLIQINQLLFELLYSLTVVVDLIVLEHKSATNS